MLNSLRQRLTLAATLTVVIALSLFAGLIFAMTYRASLTTLAASISNVTAVNAELTSEWIAAQKRVVEAAADQVNGSAMRQALDQARIAGNFFASYVGYPDKRFVAFPELELPPGYDPTARVWYRQAAQSEGTIVTEPYLDAAKKQLVQTFARATRRDGRVISVTAGDVYLDGVAKTIAAAKPSKNGFAMLLSETGVILAHADQALWMKPLADLDPGLHIARLRDAASQRAWVELDVRGQAHYLHAEGVRGTPWILVLAAPESDVLEPLLEQLTTAGILLAIIVVVVVVGNRLILGGMLRRLGDASTAMQQVGSGDADLTHRLPSSGSDEIALIANSFNRFMQSLSQTIRGVREASDTIAIAAQEISSGGQDLSQRTEGAASRLQETASAVSELTRTVRDGADHAEASKRLADEAADVARRGQDMVNKVVATMGEIHATSQRIGDIIGVIDSIAFQTNILALNAAVEAARAGDLGRGFAVVAGEVRSLAQRSSNAAREIKELIGASVDGVERGSQLVEDAGRTMAEIVRSFSEVAATIDQVSAAARTQLEGIDHVDGTVGELDRMTQQNAALAEQSAAASDSLREQAARLAQLVSTFRLDAEPRPESA